MNEKPRLLVVTDFFYPHWTGYAKGLFYFIQPLSKEIAVSVLTVHTSPASPKEEVFHDIHITRSSPLFALSRVKYSFSLITKATALIRKTDIVLLNSPLSNILPLALITRLFGKKLLIFHQGDLILPKGFFNRIIESVFDASSFVAFSVSDKIATYTLDYAQNSRTLKPFLSKYSSLLPPLEKASSKKSPTTAKKTLATLKSEGKILFGFAGRFVEEKGFDILFRAIPSVHEKLPSAHFVYAGEVNISYEDFFAKNKTLYEQVKKHVTFLGLLKDAELADFYSHIDYIVIPSRSDCFNLVQAEAMLAGAPSIVSDIPGARYLVQETGFGLVFEKGNPKDLAQKLLEAAEKKQDLQKKHLRMVTLFNEKKLEKQVRSFILSSNYSRV